jgi:DNA-directed RNA polymerase specialized sigma24 family protein
MSGQTWNDIPTELQTRIAAGDRSVLGPLAAWLQAHPPGRISEDLRQKVLVTLCRLMSNEQGRLRLNRAQSVPNFLAAIASRLRSDERRAEIRLRHFVEEASHNPSPRRADVDPIALISRVEVRKAILAGFARLAPLEREALVRALVFQQSYRHIARALFGTRSEREEQRLRKLVFRARRKLQARLSDLRYT